MSLPQHNDTGVAGTVPSLEHQTSHENAMVTMIVYNKPYYTTYIHKPLK